MFVVSRLGIRTGGWVPVAVGVLAAAIAVAPDPTTKLLLAATVPLAWIAWWLVLRPERWIHVLFFGLILLPPLPIAAGNSGAHLAPLILLPGLFAGAVGSGEWHRVRWRLPGLLLAFLAVLLASTSLAALYSGPEVAAGSVARVFLFSIGVYVFLYTFAGPRTRRFDPLDSARWMYWLAAAGALFACVDFYFQFPAPGGYGAQFIWLDTGVFRRAQGLFYEASTLGNFCAFFLVMTVVAAFRGSGARPVKSRLLLAGGFVLFSVALVLSYSRGSVVNVLVALCAFLYVRRISVKRLLPAAGAIALITVAVLRFALPQFFSLYVLRVTSTFTFFQESPNLTLSGRLANWQTLIDFLLRHPWDAILGIGYKTLPYSQYAGDGLVGDNTYLTLLVETGVVGLIIFLVLNAAILRTAFRAARSTISRASFFGTWIFCFWCGEMVQMLSGDLITYWRVLPLYFWVLATAAREAGE